MCVVSCCMFVRHYAKLWQTQQHFLVTPSALTGEARRDFIHKHESLKADQVVEDGAGASGRGGRRTDSCRAAAPPQCVCNLSPLTMCSTLSMTKCQCKKPPAQSAPLCRGMPRSTLAVRLAALHRNNTLPVPEQKKSASSSFPFSGSMLFTSVTPPPHPVEFCVMSSLRTQANVNTRKLLRNAPRTQSGRWIVAPTCKLSQRTCLSLFVLALFRCRAMLFSYYITHRHQSVCPSILGAYTLVPWRIYC